MKIKNSGSKLLAIWFISLFIMSLVHVNGAATSVYEPLIDDVTLHIRYNQPATSNPLSLAGTGDETIRELYTTHSTVIFEDSELAHFDRAMGGSGTITYSNAGTLDVVTMPSSFDTSLLTTPTGAFQTYQDHLESANKDYNLENDYTVQVWEQNTEARTVLTDIASTYNTLYTYLNLTGVQFWMEIDYNEAACDSLLDEVLADQDFHDLADETTVTASDIGEVIEDYLDKYTYDFGIGVWNETTLGTTLLTDRLDTWNDLQTSNFTELNTYNHMLSNVISAYGHLRYSVPSGYDMMIDGTYNPLEGENSYFKLVGDDVKLGILIESVLETGGVAIDNVLAAVFQIIPDQYASALSGYMLFFILFVIGVAFVAWRNSKKKGKKLDTGEEWFVACLVIAFISFLLTWATVNYTVMTW